MSGPNYPANVGNQTNQNAFYSIVNGNGDTTEIPGNLRVEKGLVFSELQNTSLGNVSPCPVCANNATATFTTPAGLVEGLYAVSIVSGSDAGVAAPFYGNTIGYFNGTGWTTVGNAASQGYFITLSANESPTLLFNNTNTGSPTIAGLVNVLFRAIAVNTNGIWPYNTV